MPALALALLAVGPPSALAEIGITGARIAQGALWVMGQTDEPNARITLDDEFVQTTDGRGRFEFRVVHHPATCIVTLKTSTHSQRAVVSDCGQIGPRGEAGPAGPAGPPGPPAGPPGAGGTREVAAATPDVPPAAPPVATPATQGRPGNDAAGQARSGEAAPPAAPPGRTPPPATAPAAEGGRTVPGTEAARPPTAPAAPPAPPPGPPPPPVVGEWLVEDGVARIAIQPCGRSVCGAVSWSKKGGDIGAEILRDMKPAGPNRWEGTILDPQSGRSYASNISLQSQNTLRVEGCVLGVLCGGQTWTRTR